MRHSARYRIIYIAVSLGMVLLPELADSQESPEQQLTGGSSRAWTLQRFVQPAGAGNACSAGEIYTFAATHELTVSRCTDGRVVPSHHSWSISGTDGDAATLAIDGVGIFLLRFDRPGAGGYRMRLRAKGAALAQPGPDRVLSLDED